MDDELAAVVKEQMVRIRDVAEMTDHKRTRLVLRDIASMLGMVAMAHRAGTTDEVEVEEQS
jgi:hypothetical protein